LCLGSWTNRSPLSGSCKNPRWSRRPHQTPQSLHGPRIWDRRS
jgi:hypothetical protein